MRAVRTENVDYSEILNSENNSHPTNNWCTRGVLRAIHSITQIPSHLINAWKDSTTPQKAFGATATIYCIVATVYIIYLQIQENTDCDCLEELKKNTSLLDQFFEQKNHEHNGSLQELFVSVDQLLTQKNLCEKDFYESGAHESSSSGTVSMHVCYDLMNRVCNFIDTSEEMLTITAEFLQKIPGKFRNNVTDIIKRMDDDLYYIHSEFDCDVN
ncbi:MAG TPA: hypothetical protein VGZ69_05360 [Candidatus Rhabdochlamydia sp.]|jgi:hypothetical protein|nr:hypothetical protein [Candidatus Rhabdochlamydia sp.]